jgi:hypothetical protein
MIERNMKIIAWPNLGTNLIDVMMLVDSGPNWATRLFGKPVEFVERPEATYVTPTLQLDHQAAQLMMDQLWNCGVRPSEGSGSAGSLAATERHLADMRKIAFNQLHIQGD